MQRGPCCETVLYRTRKAERLASLSIRVRIMSCDWLSFSKFMEIVWMIAHVLCLVVKKVL
jgi:hypothetical protein